MKNVTVIFYFTEIEDKKYWPPFSKPAITFLLCACTGVKLSIGFVNIRPGFEKMTKKAEIYLKENISLMK